MCLLSPICNYEWQRKWILWGKNNVDEKDLQMEQLKSTVKLLDVEVDGSKMIVNKLKDKIG